MATGNEKRYADQVMECESVSIGVSGSKIPMTGTSSRRLVIEDVLAVTLTAAQSGALIIFDKVDGATITLPPPIVGLWFDFDVDVASTSVGQKIITDAATTFIKGVLNKVVTATGATTQDTANGTTHLSINMNGTTTGGIAGSRFRLTCRSATVWKVEGYLNSSGTLATSFATT